MCLRFVFLLTTQVAVGLRLSLREKAWKTAEILVLRHQLALLQPRRLCRPRLNWADRMCAAIGPSGPRPFSTHGVTVESGVAVKRFRSPVDGDQRRLYGDEPRREWRALTLLARYTPGLAPGPVRAELDADPPLIAIGHPMGAQVRAGSLGVRIGVDAPGGGHRAPASE
jgi:hypothetical protein